MPETPQILLLDDGELDDVAQLLECLDLAYTRLKGGEVRSGIGPPRDLLIATPRRSSSVEEGSPEGAKPGRPVRVIVTEEDSNSMRRMLRRAGFVDVKTADVNVTSLEEQRATRWMQFQSLGDYLDPVDKTKTVEGYPAPARAILVARKPG